MISNKIDLDRIKLAIKYTRLNGLILNDNARNCYVGRGYYQNGINIQRIDNSLVLASWTVEASVHKISCHLTFDAKTKKLEEGYVNCFALGIVDADQSYLDYILEELDTIQFDRLEY